MSAALNIANINFQELLNSMLRGREVEIKVNTDDLNNCAEDIERKVTSARNHINEISSTLRGTATYWEGSTADRALSDFSVQFEDINRQLDAINSYVTVLRKISGKYVETEKRNVESAGSLPVDVIY